MGHDITLKFLKMTNEQQKSTLRHFTKMPVAQKAIVMDGHKQAFHSLRQNNRDIATNILSYVALIKAISSFIDENKVNINAQKIKGNFYKKQPKSEQLINKWSLLKELRIEQKLSFRQISIYLQKYHKLKVSYSTICEIWNKLEKEGKNNG